MTSNVALQDEPEPIVACTISRDVQNFDLLIEDMESLCGENWGDLSVDDAGLFFDQPESDTLEFVVIAIDQEDEGDADRLVDLVKRASQQKIKVLIVAEEVSPILLHRLLKIGAQEFIPYPLPDGALNDAIERMRERASQAEMVAANLRTNLKATGDRDGVVIPVHGLAGGTGATTFAVNLAWELANIDEGDEAMRVCLIDLDLQFGSVSTYLDLPRREAVFELLQDTSSMDSESFMQALLTYEEKLQVMTAPSELIPLDIIGQKDVQKIIEIAKSNFDYVVIDMPKTVVMWTETVLTAAHVYFAMVELDMRSAQNTLRVIRALKGEDLPYQKLRYVLNRAPGFTDLNGKSRVKRMAESLDIKIEVLMPDGSKQVAQSNDHGVPLSEVAAKNPLRKEIQKLALSIHETNIAAAEGA
ncbi:pilus assembly protein CpaE [Silicimonas algicola]|uniref:Pilus assembly protein CpaE n=1 Tax=Silicimonas algicola TaxID=1826607 RepID=A0A316GE12_9RHOB|nr:AAA family ATPase [Silicimonas algicola]AZQ66165.1 pilus assembly protein CpaE [Silicimonas algicola]PWK58475.1 pilus assembly protein CpaE [Silicimonas algicola]